jgi:hypothetical protein
VTDVFGLEPKRCPLCATTDAAMRVLAAEVLELRLALADSQATRSARQDLERVNARLVEANETISDLRGKNKRLMGTR